MPASFGNKSSTSEPDVFFGAKPPDWRYRLASRWKEAGRQAIPEQADLLIRRAASVIHSAVGSGRPVARRAELARHPDRDVATAMAWAEDPTRETAATLEAFFLSAAGETRAARRLQLPPAAVNAYDALFFDVTDRLRDEPFIVKHAIANELSLGPASTRVRRVAMKLVAYFAGEAFEWLYGWTEVSELSFERISRQLLIAKCDELALLMDQARTTLDTDYLKRLEEVIRELYEKAPQLRRQEATPAMERIRAIYSRSLNIIPAECTPSGAEVEPWAQLVCPSPDVRAALKMIATWLIPLPPCDVAAMTGATPLRDESGVRKTPGNADEFELAMSSKFDATTLQRTNCFEVAAPPRLISGLREPGALAIALRSGPDNVFDIAAAGRPTAAPPLMASFLFDFSTCMRIDAAHRTLIAAGDVAEAASWQMIGLPAVPVDDLSRCSETRLDHVASALRFSEAEGATSKEARSVAEEGLIYRNAPANEAIDIVFVVPAWSPTTWTLREDDAFAGTLKILQRFIARAPDLVGGVGIWRPKAEELIAMRSAWMEPNGPPFSSLINRSLTTRLYLPPSLINSDAAPQEGLSYVDARRQLTAAAARDPSSVETELARREFLDVAERQRGERIVAEAEFGDDPIEAELLYALGAIDRQAVALEGDALSSDKDVFARTLATSKQVTQIVKLLNSNGRTSRRRSKPRAPR